MPVNRLITAAPVGTEPPGKDFAETLRSTKLRLLRMHYESNAGHLGGNFSCIDALMVLHHLVLDPDDRFVLSKGHSAGALYATLWSLGKIHDAELATFSRDDTRLPGHPSGTGVPGLLFATGSLGHGPSLAAGLALAAKQTGSGRRVFCLCSDGEWQEGSCWEALTFAVHHHLDNLTIVVDQNGLQGFGTTEEVVSCPDLTPRLAVFGAQAERIPGHDAFLLWEGLRRPGSGAPRALVLDTVKGKDLHFEGELRSHYLPLTDEQYRIACDNLSRSTRT
jgi:transketolase